MNILQKNKERGFPITCMKQVSDDLILAAERICQGNEETREYKQIYEHFAHGISDVNMSARVNDCHCNI